MSASIALAPVASGNWRDVARLTVHPDQAEFVAAPSYYLALCCYGDTWNPLAISVADEVVGFLMWGIDPADQSCWLGGFVIDRQHQGRGYGQAAVEEAIRMLHDAHGHTRFALSYVERNATARRLYERAGFVETGEHEDGEVVARRAFDG